MTHSAEPTDRDRPLVVGLVADPGLPADLARGLAERLPEEMARCDLVPRRWAAQATTGPIALDEDNRVPLITEARKHTAADGWDILIFLTDLPRQRGTRAIVADVNVAERAAVLSLPSLGWFRLRAHLTRVVVRLVRLIADRGGVSGADSGNGPPEPRQGRPRLQAVPADEDGVDLQLAFPGSGGKRRLLLGMVRENRPWRLVPTLSKAIAAAAATAAFGVFYPIIWAMADQLSHLRLGGISLFAIVVMALWLITYNDLWERPEGRRRALLYNLATVTTLAIGVSFMYVILLVVTALAAVTVISPLYLASRLGHPAGPIDYLELAWLASSMGTIAGALGSSMETGRTVRHATFSRREQDRRVQAQQERERSRERGGQPGGWHGDHPTG